MAAPPFIRPATPDDYPAMDLLCAAALRGEGGLVYDSAAIEAWANAAHPQRYAIEASRGTVYFVAERKGRVAAYGGFNPKQARIEALFVDPACREEELGEIMLAFLMRKAREHALASVSVQSLLSEAGFYHRHGFHSVAQQSVCIEPGIELEAVLMRRAARA